MGFYHLRHDLNGRSDCKSTVVFDWITDNKGDKPWIVIDYNNFILSMKTTGGYLMLLEWRLKLFWESLAKCHHPVVFCFISNHAPFGMIAILLTSFGISPRCLDMSICIAAWGMRGPQLRNVVEQTASRIRPFWRTERGSSDPRLTPAPPAVV